MSNDKSKDMKETLFFGGMIRVGGPNIAERLKRGEEISIDDHGECMEFLLAVENRLKDQLLEVTPWINMADAEIEISAEPPDVLSSEPNLNLIFQAGEGRTFDLLINIEQARVIGKYCEAFVKGYEAFETLTLKHHIKAPEDGDETAEAEAPAALPAS